MLSQNTGNPLHTDTETYMRGPETSSVRSSRTVPCSYMHIHKYQ